MQKTTVVLITGMPATGKTTLGKLLSEKYHLPIISKDSLKERMFDTLGSSDKEWSLKVSAASHRIMDYILEEELQAGHSIILESNFKYEIDSERFARIQKQHDCSIVQILCWANGEVLFRRFIERANSSARHEGHVEIPAERIRQDFIDANGKDKPLAVNGETIELDTTNLQAIDYDKVYRVVEKTLSKS